MRRDLDELGFWWVQRRTLKLHCFYIPSLSNAREESFFALLNYQQSYLETSIRLSFWAAENRQFSDISILDTYYMHRCPKPNFDRKVEIENENESGAKIGRFAGNLKRFRAAQWCGVRRGFFAYFVY